MLSIAIKRHGSPNALNATVLLPRDATVHHATIILD